MFRSGVRTVVAGLLLLAAPVAGTAAQSSVTLERGASVRVRSVTSTAPDEAATCEGRIADVARDTVLIGRAFGCPKGSYLARVRVARGNRGSRLAHAGIGVLVGVVVGGVIGKRAAGDGCTVGDCSDYDLAARIKTLIGATLGGATGFALGGLLPAGPRWVDAGVIPVHVGAFTVHPKLRVSAAGRAAR